MGLFNKILGNIKLKILNSYFGYTVSSAPFDGEFWDHDVARATIDAIATRAAMGNMRHVIMENGQVKETVYDSPLAKMINERPNDAMSGFEFKYRMFANLETKTTAIAYIDWQVVDGNVIPVGIYPVDYANYQFRQVIGGGWAIEYNDFEGNTGYLRLQDCIIMRKFYNNHQASGDGNAPIYKALDMSKASDEGFIEALQVSNKVRGIIKQKKSMLDPEDVKESQNNFADRFKSAAQNGGIVAVDSMEDFKELNVNAYSANAVQQKQIESRIRSFLRTSESIVNSDYTEQQGIAWAQSVIEPLWEIFAQAVTCCGFTPQELDKGNKMIMSGGRLMGASLSTCVQVLNATKDTGELTTNERREILGYPPVDGGDVRQVSLNYVSADSQKEYQLGKNKDKNKEDDSDGKGKSDGKADDK